MPEGEYIADVVILAARDDAQGIRLVDRPVVYTRWIFLLTYPVSKSRLRIGYDALITKEVGSLDRHIAGAA